VRKSLVDEHGKVYLLTKLGFGLVHTLDVPRAAQALEMAQWTLEDAGNSDLPVQYGYVMSPEKTANTGMRA
jgi:hypothetical protein